MYIIFFLIFAPSFVLPSMASFLYKHLKRSKKGINEINRRLYERPLPSHGMAWDNTV